MTDQPQFQWAGRGVIGRYENLTLDEAERQELADM